MNTGPLEAAREAWGDDLTDWLETLAIECGKTSQNKVAALLGRSAAMISQVLRRKYPGDLAALEERVRGVFQSQTVACPALGTMPSNICQDWRRKASEPSQSGLPLRGRMRRECRRCPRFLKTTAAAAPADEPQL